MSAIEKCQKCVERKLEDERKEEKLFVYSVVTIVGFTIVAVVGLFKYYSYNKYHNSVPFPKSQMKPIV